VVEETEIQELEKFFHQSMRGIHHLFDRDEISRIMKSSNEEKDVDFHKIENLDRIQKLMIELAKCPSLNDKRYFLEQLDPESYELVVRTYFQIVDSTLLSTNATKH
jgi:hypothetical protein